MLRNVAGQSVDIQAISRTDGSEVTTGAAVFVRTDVNGTPGTWAAGAGTLTHMQQGVWRYDPTQAETNGDHIAFQLRDGTNLISQVVNVYTREAVPAVNLTQILGTLLTEQTAGNIASAFATLFNNGDQISARLLSELSSHTPADVDSQLSGTHGAGSWATATGFSTHDPAAVDAQLTGSHGAGSWQTATGFSTHDPAAVDAELTSSHGAGSWQTADVSGIEDPMVELKTTIASVSSATNMTLADGPSNDGDLVGKTLIVETAGTLVECRIALYVGSNKQVQLLRPLPIEPQVSDPCHVRLSPRPLAIEDVEGLAGPGTTTSSLVLDANDPHFAEPDVYLGSRVYVVSSLAQQENQCRIATGTTANGVTFDEPFKRLGANYRYVIRPENRAKVVGLIEAADAQQIGGSKDAADRHADAAQTMFRGVVVAGSTDTGIIVDAEDAEMTPAEANNFVGRELHLVDGTKHGQISRITAYVQNTSTRGTFTVEGYTNAPATGDRVQLN